ncbi:MAG TPA: efflux RND transporter periplasmic adaptor subunit [Anaerolineales bacterium]|nr:efflux RND transporter periplasmic adaptor subunit [Anaerolineales bacterium]
MKIKFILTLLMGISLSACASIGQTPAPLPTVILGNSSTSTQVRSSVTASGFVVPAAEAHMAFSLAGLVEAVHVAAGDQVHQGDLLAELDSTAYLLEFDQAIRALRELTSPAAIAAASQAYATAQQEADKAQKKVVGLLYPRASDTFIKNLEGQIELAKEKLALASDDYHGVAWRADDDPDKAAALVAMTRAQIDLNQLIANLNWYTGKPSDVDAALAQANLDAANAALQEAHWYLAALNGETVPVDSTGSRLAELEQARDDVAAAEASLKATRLIAPISGTVITTNVIPGEYAAPGEVLLVISDISRLRVETTDLSERDVPLVQIGEPTTVHIDALDQDVSGRVSAISLVADTLGGDVVYKTTIDLDAMPPGILAGMTVQVQFNPMQ